MNTSTQPALTERASSGLRPPVDGSIILGSVEPEGWGRCRRATGSSAEADEGDLLAIGVQRAVAGRRGISTFKKTTGPSARQQEPRRAGWQAMGRWGRRRDCTWRALEPFAVSLQPDGPKLGSTGGAMWLSASRLGANQLEGVDARLPSRPLNGYHGITAQLAFMSCRG
jgi:hypothetical protein